MKVLLFSLSFGKNKSKFNLIISGIQFIRPNFPIKQISEILINSPQEKLNSNI